MRQRGGGGGSDNNDEEENLHRLIGRGEDGGGGGLALPHRPQQGHSNLLNITYIIFSCRTSVYE